jgi:type III pantothenate kinase
MKAKLVQTEYLCLAIGNSRLHWAYFRDGRLQSRWNSSHLSRADEIDRLFPANVPSNIPLYLASVVPQQTPIWQEYPQTTIITLADLPLGNLYPTLGIDRGLAALGAGVKYGFPCLVIDGGTALTFTGVNEDKNLVGGAILGGLRLQFNALASNTAALPQINLSSELPDRWALDTEGAIISGIVRMLMAGIEDFIADWRSKYPNSRVIVTGGDGELISSYLGGNFKPIVDDNLIFWGMERVVKIYP